MFSVLQSNSTENSYAVCQPPGVPKKVFIAKLQEILNEKYQYITINLRSEWSERFRKGLAQVIDFGPTAVKRRYNDKNEEPKTEQFCEAKLPKKVKQTEKI